MSLWPNTPDLVDTGLPLQITGESKIVPAAGYYSQYVL